MVIRQKVVVRIKYGGDWKRKKEKLYGAFLTFDLRNQPFTEVEGREREREREGGSPPLQL